MNTINMQCHYYAVSFVFIFLFCVVKSVDHNITLPNSKCNGKEKMSTLLDVSMDFIDKAMDLYPDCVEDDSNCDKKEKALAFLEVASKVITEIKKTSCPEPKCPELKLRPMDCAELLRDGHNESREYEIWPRSRHLGGKSITVFCDMHTDGGGWTVIQRRGNFSTPKDYFYQKWNDYKKGFGNLTEEFWIGNDNLFAISNQANYSVRFDLKDAEGKPGYALYDTFWIADEIFNYNLGIKGYSGNAGDSMSSHNKAAFYTIDRQNGAKCPEKYKAGWWYAHWCHVANLNGLYQPGVEDSRTGIIWEKWKGIIGLSGSEIKLRPQKVDVS